MTTPDAAHVPPKPPDDDRLRRDGQRIDVLLEELREMAPAPTYQRIEELVQRVVRLYGAGLARLSEASQESLREGASNEERRREAWLRRVCEDDLLAGLLLIHGLHPQSPQERIRDALATLSRRTVHRAELIDIDDHHVARVRSTDSMNGDARALIERAVMDAAPELLVVRVVSPRAETGLVQLQKKRARSSQ